MPLTLSKVHRDRAMNSLAKLAQLLEATTEETGEWRVAVATDHAFLKDICTTIDRAYKHLSARDGWMEPMRARPSKRGT